MGGQECIIGGMQERDLPLPPERVSAWHEGSSGSGAAVLAGGAHGGGTGGYCGARHEKPVAAVQLNQHG